jgi:hypothetical protein
LNLNVYIVFNLYGPLLNAWSVESWGRFLFYEESDNDESETRSCCTPGTGNELGGKSVAQSGFAGLLVEILSGQIAAA